MIAEDQIKTLAGKYQIAESVIVREYFQLLFLNTLYSFSGSSQVIFKGGTAIHLIFKAPRFSEDLDFTVGIKTTEFPVFINKVFVKLNKEEAIMFKEIKTISGKSFLLTASPVTLRYQIFVNLDFSFREKVFKTEKTIISTEYPVLFNNYVFHLSKEEIFAEKIRAIMTRRKGRDLYDLWYLLNQNVDINTKLIKEKLKYYHLEKTDSKQILARVKDFPQWNFIQDLRPFVPAGEREKLASFFDYLKDYLSQKLI